MSSAGGQNTIFSMGADPAGVLSALDQIIAGLDDVGAAIDEMSAGASLGDIDASLSEMAGMAGTAAGEMSGLADAETAVHDSAGGLSEGLAGLSEGLGGVFEQATKLAGAFLEFQAAMEVVNAVKDFIGSMFGMNESFQSLTITLKNFVGAQQAADLVNWVQQFGMHVPFTTQAIMQAVVATTALGDNAEQVVPMLATLAAQMGVSLPTATQALQDAQNGLWRMMERDLHVTKDQLVAFGLEVDSKGHVLNDSLLPALEKFTQAKFPTALSDRMATFGGLLAEATDLIQLFAKSLGAPLFAMAQEGLGKIVAWAQDPTTQQWLNNLATLAGDRLASAFRFLGDVFETVGQVIRQDLWPVFQGMGNLISPLLGPLGQLGTAIGGIFSQSGGNLAASLHDIATGFRDMTQQGQPLGDVIDGIGTAISTLATWIQNVWQGATQGKGPFAQLQADLQPVRDLLNKVADAIKNLIGWFIPAEPHLEKVAVILRKVTENADGTFTQINKLVTVMEKVPGHASGFQQMLETLAPAFDAVGQAIKAVIDWFSPTEDHLKQVGKAVELVKGHASGFQQTMAAIAQFLAPLKPLLVDIGLAVLDFGQGFVWAIEQLNQPGRSVLEWVWTNIKANLIPTFQNLWVVITTQLMPAFETLGIALKPLLPVFEVIGAWLGTIFTADLGTLIAMLGAVIEWFGKWLTGLIEFVSGAMNALAGFINFMVDLFTGKWGRLGDDLNLMNKGIGQAIIGVWDMTFGNLIGTLSDFINNVVHLWMNLADQLVGHSIIPDMVNAIGAWFNKLPGTVGGIMAQLALSAVGWAGQILVNFITGLANHEGGLIAEMQRIAGEVSGPLEGLAGQAFGWGANIISNFISGLTSGTVGKIAQAVYDFEEPILAKMGQLEVQAVSWGEHLIENFIQGIRNKLSELEGVIQNVATIIASKLHFSVPDEGPLREANTWMPEMMEQFIQGIRSKIPALGAAANAAAGAIAGNFNGQGTPGVGGIPLGAAANGINAASNAGMNNPAILSVLVQMLQALQQQGRAAPLGAAVPSAHTGSILQQFSGGVNFNLAGMDPLSQASYFNMLAGLAYEFAQRGAINGAAW